MFTMTVTDDVSLKLLQRSDAPSLFGLIDRSRMRLRTWLPWVDTTSTVEDSQAFIEGALSQFAASAGFQAAVLYRGELAGMVGFHDIHWANRAVSIGYWLGDGYEGHGIMTIACKALVEIAFATYALERVEIRAALENQRSRAVACRLGFVEEGVCRRAEWVLGRPLDHVIYGMLREDWGNAEPTGQGEQEGVPLSTGVTVRALSREDAGRYREIRLRALRDHPTAFVTTSEEFAKRTPEEISAQLEPVGESRTLGAFAGEDLIGIVTFSPEQRQRVRHIAGVQGLYVVSDRRSSGVGRALLRELTTWARQCHGIERLRLSVTTHNQAAIALYRAFGFAVYGVERNALRVDGQSYDEWHMDLRI